jgi:hypothetical protein
MRKARLGLTITVNRRDVFLPFFVFALAGNFSFMAAYE